jgi:uncharacterized protein (DUF2141 family)
MVTWILSGALIFSTVCSAGDPLGPPSTLTVLITGIPNERGRVGVALDQSPKGCPSDPSQAMRTAFVDIHHGRSVITLRDVTPGTYAVAIFHDENHDGTLDRNWLGFPAEATAVSNNPKRHIHRPTFDAAKFTMGGSLCVAIQFQ